MTRHLLLRPGKPQLAFPIRMVKDPALLKLFSNELAWQVFTSFITPAVPIDAAKTLGIHEQKIYYYVHRFKKAGLLKAVREEQRHGTVATYYQVTDSCFGFQTHETGGYEMSAPLYNKKLEPFVANGKLHARIVVGSPDPHGPWQARASDACCAIDFALFLGGYTNSISVPNYKLDTEIRERELKGNLILIGGPHVNMVTKDINASLPVYIDVDEKTIISRQTGKTYTDDEYGMVALITNPWDADGRVLVVAGKRFQGTRAAIIALITDTDRVLDGGCRVIKGVDKDGDGIIDAAEIVE